MPEPPSAEPQSKSRPGKPGRFFPETQLFSRQTIEYFLARLVGGGKRSCIMRRDPNANSGVRRFLAPWKDSHERPVIYHCISRVVERRLAFGPNEKEQFRTYMRMYEKFSGCRVLSYCLMCNHVHILLEVPPMKTGGLSDAELLDRLSAIYSQAFVSEVAKELTEAREKVANGQADEVLVSRIHDRFVYRMHDLGEFMKVLLLRFTRWFNHKHERTGVLWESRFKSVLVEEGVAAKTIAAYIDLNPVRAGMVKDPAEYRWSSYGEAVGGGAKGNGKKARAGLVRALGAHKGWLADAKDWPDVAKEYRMILFESAEEQLKEVVSPEGELEVKAVCKGIKSSKVAAELARLDAGGRDVTLRKMLRHRVRYFTAGAVVGSRGFVDEVFVACRHRFGSKRKSGARKFRGDSVAPSGTLWSLRDLKKA
jgi:putative transposase